MKKQLPLLLGFLVGAFPRSGEFYVPAGGVHAVQGKLLEFAQVLAAAAYVLGGINVVQVNLPIISRRREDWQYKLVLLGSAVIMLLAGVAWQTFGSEVEAGQIAYDAPVAGAPAGVSIETNEEEAEVSLDNSAFAPAASITGDRAVLAAGAHAVVVRMPRTGYSEYRTTFTLQEGQHVTVRARLGMQWGTSGRVYTWLYDHVFAPCNSTMFALLAFFIASAAFRAFRARNVDAALLLGSAILIMIGRVPIGRAMSSWFPAIADWIIDIPNNAGRRAIMMGAALGAIATSLRVILGMERSHLGGD